MKNQILQKIRPFLESYKKNFLVFLEVMLSVIPVIIIAVCGISLGAFFLSQQTKYLFIFLGTLVGAPLLQTTSEHLEQFFAKHTRD